MFIGEAPRGIDRSLNGAVVVYTDGFLIEMKGVALTLSGTVCRVASGRT